MKAGIYTLLISLILFIVALIPIPGLCAPESVPTVLVFNVNANENIDPAFVRVATRALRDYFRQTGKVEAALFDKNSPSVSRAILEKKITPDKAESYDSKSSRIDIARALGFNYVCGARLAIEADKVVMSLWMINADNPKQKWESPDFAAEAGKVDSKDIQNAIQSVTSGLVNDMARNAFQKLSVARSEDTAASSDNTPSSQSGVINTSTNAGDLALQASDNMKQGNIAAAIGLLQKAITANPKNISLRIQLAEAYHKRGMDQEAADELDRAVLIGGDKDAITAAKTKIFSGESIDTKTTQTAVETPANDAVTDTPQNTVEPPKKTVESRVQLTPGSAAALINEADKLWNANDGLGAEQAYKKAIAADPKEWRSYERLAILLASEYRFDDSRKVLTELANIQPAPPPEVLTSRYGWLTRVLDYNVDALLGQMESDVNSFESKRTTREAAYNSVKSCKTQLQALAVFADDLVYPPEMKKANANRVQACRLGAQSANALMDYLETNLTKFKNNASIFIEQARVEIIEARKPNTPAE